MPQIKFTRLPPETNAQPANAVPGQHSSEGMVGHPSAGRVITSRCWIDPDAVVYGGGDSLCASEVAFRPLDRYMTRQELNLP